MDVKINFFEMLWSLITQVRGQNPANQVTVPNSKNQKEQHHLTNQAKKRKKMVQRIIADLSPVLEKLHEYDTEN
jgi:hypothetical protein